MSKVAFIVGAGFSTALTSGDMPLMGSQPLPTLDDLGKALLNHIQIQQKNHPEVFKSFSMQTQTEGFNALDLYFSPQSNKKYNFEQFASLMAFRASLFKTSLRDDFPDLPGADPSTLRFILHGLYDFFATSMSFDGNSTAQRNYFYKVNDPNRAACFQRSIHKIRESGNSTFISFNYDGILEAFLNISCDQSLGLCPYWPEISHGIPAVKPENLVETHQLTISSKINNPVRVIKPHGSMHFFPVREEMRSILGGPSMVALSPRLDIGFDSQKMQRDIDELHAWQYISPTPMIVPPVMNKDSFLSSDYFREMLRLTYKSIDDADQIVVLGFSPPPSDLHITAVFESINWSGKQVFLCYKKTSYDKTEENWRRVIGETSLDVVCDAGLDFSSESKIDQFWSTLSTHLKAV